jgi:hypothetical protein
MIQCYDEGDAAKLHGAIDPIRSVRLSTDKNLDCCCGRCAKGAFCHTCARSHCGWCCDGTCASCTTSFCGFLLEYLHSYLVPLGLLAHTVRKIIFPLKNFTALARLWLFFILRRLVFLSLCSKNTF